MPRSKIKVNRLKRSPTSMDTIMLNIDDYLHGTECLSWEAQGVYMRLLCHYYKTGRALPYDVGQLANALKYKHPRSFRLHLDELLEFEKFRIQQRDEGPVLVNDRAETEIRYYHARKAESRESSRRGGEATARMIQARKAAQAVVPEDPQVGAGLGDGPGIGSGTSSGTSSGEVGGRIGGIFTPELVPHIEENQQLSMGSNSILFKMRASAQVQVSAPAPVRVDETGSAVNEKVDLNDWMAAKKAAKASGLSPEDQAMKQRALALLDQIEERVAPFLKNQSTVLTAEYVEKWLRAGADVEYHIFPVIDAKIRDVAEKGMRVYGLGLFDDGVMGAIRRGTEALAEREPRQSGYGQGHGQGGYGQTTKRPEVVPDEVTRTIKLARNNGWSELFEEMRPLLTAANGGDVESLRKLKDLHAKHGDRVLTPHADWLAQAQQSSAA